MSKLSYLTRGGDMPTGKPNILLLSHPRDIGLAVDTVAADVLAAIDAAVWYSPDGNDSFSPDGLFDVNLVLLAVTELLLRDFSAASRVIELAEERSIPVLPILLEPASLVDFEQTLGTVQFLDRTDMLGSDYSRRLKDRLSDITVPSSVYASISEMLDATLFLSYRHVDRALADRLMTAIHDRPDLSDVAIWYDDQLTVGENYNDEILRSLRAADLFLLVVTPALLIQDNYVMTREYPEALAAGIPILPVMMQPTELEPLRAAYPMIPDPCTIAEVGDRLSHLLGDKLDLSNDTDPTHLYFLGVAYQRGISVEIDNVRAMNLLIRAAELGSNEALRRLGVAYRFGDGAPVSLDLAADYLRKYFASCEEKYLTENSLPALEALVDSLRLLVPVLREIGASDCGRLVHDYLSYSIQCYKLAYTHEFLRSIVDAIEFSIAIFEERGELDEAANLYEKALTITETYYKECPGDDTLELYVRTLRLFAAFRLSGGDATPACELIVKALEVLEGECHVRPAEDLRVRRLALEVYSVLGDICYRLGDLEGALRACEKVIELCEGIVRFNFKFEQIYLSILFNHERLRMIYLLSLSRYDEAEALLPRLDQLSADPRVGRSDSERLNLSIKHIVIHAEIAIGKCDYEAAEAHLKRAEQLCIENATELQEEIYTDIHTTFDKLYYNWRKPHLGDYHRAILLETRTENAISRGDGDDFDSLAKSYEDVGSRFGKEGKRWRKYAELARARRLRFYPDDSHLEPERDAHLRALGSKVLVNLVVLVIFIGFAILEWRLGLVFDSAGERVFVNVAVAYFFMTVFGDVGVYLFLRARRRHPYSALEVFKSTERVSLFALRANIALLPVFLGILVTSFFLDYGENSALSIAVLVVLALLAVGERITNTVNRAITRERDRAFFRISRLMPLTDEDEGAA